MQEHVTTVYLIDGRETVDIGIVFSNDAAQEKDYVRIT